MSGNDESVLDVLHAAANGGTGPIPMQRAHDRVAELIAADDEYDAASAAAGKALLQSDEERISAYARLIRSDKRRAAALAACKGGVK